MGKFVIECPACGRYAEAKTGFLTRRKIDCLCGNTILVKVDRYSTRRCLSCGNDFVYDAADGKKVACPVCKKNVKAFDDNAQVPEITCGQCGIKMMALGTTGKCSCPVCDYENDIAERLASEKLTRNGLDSVIKYEGDNTTFIWKHPVEDFNYGTQLIVHESQEAIFVKDGQALDLFGPGRYTLETQQIPLLEKAYKLPSESEQTFHTEVYFINKTVQMAIKWGTPDKVRFIDPLTGVPLEIGASGEMNMQVDNSRKLLLKLVGTTKGISWEGGTNTTKSLQASFRPLITQAVKTNLATVMKTEAFDLLEIDGHLDYISENLKAKIVPEFEEYGLTIPQFYVTSIVLPEDDPNFKRIRELHTITLQTRMLQADATVKVAKAQSETLYRTAQEQSQAAIEAAHREAELQRQMTETEIARHEAERKIIAAQADAQALRMSGLTEAEIMQAKGYSQKDVIQADVQKAYAEGIGNMGPAISAGGGSGLMGDMLGLGVGMAAASAIAPQIGGMIQGMTPNLNGGATPMQSMSQANAGNAWDCSCGSKGVVGNFCNNCGGKKPMPENVGVWDCTCGNKGVTGNFCNNCGAKKPEVPATWDCSCGKTGITGNFCDNCGQKRG